MRQPSGQGSAQGNVQASVQASAQAAVLFHEVFDLAIEVAEATAYADRVAAHIWAELQQDGKVKVSDLLDLINQYGFNINASHVSSAANDTTDLRAELTADEDANGYISADDAGTAFKNFFKILTPAVAAGQVSVSFAQGKYQEAFQNILDHGVKLINDFHNVGGSLFAAFDTNHQGYLTGSELAAEIEQYFPRLDTRTVAAQYNITGDEKLDVNDFVALFAHVLIANVDDQIRDNLGLVGNFKGHLRAAVNQAGGQAGGQVGGQAGGQVESQSGGQAGVHSALQKKKMRKIIWQKRI